MNYFVFFERVKGTINNQKVPTIYVESLFASIETKRVVHAIRTMLGNKQWDESAKKTIIVRCQILDTQDNSRLLGEVTLFRYRRHTGQCVVHNTTNLFRMYNKDSKTSSSKTDVLAEAIIDKLRQSLKRDLDGNVAGDGTTSGSTASLKNGCKQR
ncbi:hypothetical protein GJ496_008364 [Pomphorhynchus laevis]|nr:hypothetical protein GJ496_008364 [Pomphorhynchus laevis]